jgi:hypothetical protein
MIIHMTLVQCGESARAILAELFDRSLVMATLGDHGHATVPIRIEML